MSELTVSQHNETYIKVIRVHHHYYLDERQNGFVIAMNCQVHRDAAIEKVQAANNGRLPDKCNFDVCHPRSWSWRMENHMQAVPA